MGGRVAAILDCCLCCVIFVVVEVVDVVWLEGIVVVTVAELEVIRDSGGLGGCWWSSCP